jgi:hypothetical protein
MEDNGDDGIVVTNSATGVDSVLDIQGFTGATSLETLLPCAVDFVATGRANFIPIPITLLYDGPSLNSESGGISTVGHAISIFDS